jgi:hypothetical protein
MRQMEQFISEEPQTLQDMVVKTRNEIQFALAADLADGFDELVEKKYALRLEEYHKEQLQKGVDVLAEFRKNPEETLVKIKEAIGFVRTETGKTIYH